MSALAQLLLEQWCIVIQSVHWLVCHLNSGVVPSRVAGPFSRLLWYLYTRIVFCLALYDACNEI
jgi:hypothetical protein